jgi:hypothetical protein
MRPGLTASRAERIDGTSGAQMLHAVGWGVNEHNAKGQCRDTLLELDAAVHCEEDIILTAHSTQKLAVLDPGPAATGNGVYGMTRKYRSKAYG